MSSKDKVRKSPSVKASKTIEGTIMIGNDGYPWIVSKISNGTHKWVKFKASKDSAWLQASKREIKKEYSRNTEPPKLPNAENNLEIIINESKIGKPKRDALLKLCQVGPSEFDKLGIAFAVIPLHYRKEEWTYEINDVDYFHDEVWWQGRFTLGRHRSIVGQIHITDNKFDKTFTFINFTHTNIIHKDRKAIKKIFDTIFYGVKSYRFDWDGRPRSNLLIWW